MLFAYGRVLRGNIRFVLGWPIFYFENFWVNASWEKLTGGSSSSGTFWKYSGGKSSVNSEQHRVMFLLFCFRNLLLSHIKKVLKWLIFDLNCCMFLPLTLDSSLLKFYYLIQKEVSPFLSLNHSNGLGVQHSSSKCLNLIRHIHNCNLANIWVRDYFRYHGFVVVQTGRVSHGFLTQ